MRTERLWNKSSTRLASLLVAVVVTPAVTALNVLNRVNVGPADGTVMRDTGEALGFTERLYPRLMTAGIRFEF